MEAQYSIDVGTKGAAVLARQSLAEFVTGENAVAGVDRDLSVAERKMLVARDALAFVISVSDGSNRLRLQNALASIGTCGAADTCPQIAGVDLGLLLLLRLRRIVVAVVAV